MSHLALLFVGPAADDAGEVADIMAAVRLVKQRDATVQELMPVCRCTWHRWCTAVSVHWTHRAACLKLMRASGILRQARSRWSHRSSRRSCI